MNNLRYNDKVYTPEKIVDKIIKLIDLNINELILEPSIGKGVFVFSLLKYIQKKIFIKFKKIKKI